jgi:hypothetical protein
MQIKMCAKALWIQEIKSLFDSMKTLIIVLEFAMCSIELEIHFNKNYLPFFFFHNVSGLNTAVFFLNLACIGILSKGLNKSLLLHKNLASIIVSYKRRNVT